MALRVPKAELTGLSESMIEQFGAVPEPLEATWHNPKVAEAASEFGGKVGEWDAVDETLKSFAHMAVAAQVGCGWCLDFGYFQAQNENLDLAKASQVPRWRESEVFTPLERDVQDHLPLKIGAMGAPNRWSWPARLPTACTPPARIRRRPWVTQ